jgi:3-hydroxyacyl-[acyl-carrier-protein] dehydratase
LLLNDLYQFTKISTGELEGDFHFEVKINPDHSIFTGHFPEVPVMPGVCLMQMIADAASVASKKSLRIIEGVDMKFTAIVNPQEGTDLNLQLNVVPTDAGKYKVAGVAIFNGITSFKFKGIVGE